MNYVEPVNKQHPPPDKIWYLSTHPVENPNKPGKIRRVANAASKFKGCSLNTCLLTGPDLLADLLELILRFREHAIGVLADIEGMFLQIAIRKEDQSALRFVWLEDNLIRQYQYIRLFFGANCSPCCAICYSENAQPTIRLSSRKLIKPSEKTSTWMTSLTLFQMRPMLVVLPKTYATSSCEAGSVSRNSYLTTPPPLIIFQNPRKKHPFKRPEFLVRLGV